MTSEETYASVEVKVTLRLMGADLEPQEVTLALGLEASSSHRRGDVRKNRAGREYSAYTEGLWELHSTLEATASLDQHLRSLLGLLRGRHEVIRKLRDEGLRADLLIGIFGSDSNVGFGVSPESLAEIAELGLALEFDVYCG